MTPMSLKNLFQFCSEELQRSWRALAAGYEMLREMDEMALGTLLAYLRDR
jgi:hypothetical protein